MSIQQFELTNISCSSCAMHIEGLEDDIEGIEKVDVNFKKRVMKVQYDPEAVTPEMIMTAVTKMGYGATPVALSETKGSRWDKLFRS